MATMTALDGMEAVLFDLDGTLLGMDMDAFIPEYVGALAGSVADIVDPRLLSVELMRASDMMIRETTGYRTNEETFDSHFYKGLGKSKVEMEPRLMRFYNEVFPSLGTGTTPIPGAVDVVTALGKRGYRLALATNPVFPRIAIEHRLRWAGLSADQFELVTSFEDMHYCKPSPMYFREIADRMGVNPEKCMMVGNDVDDDLPSGKIGMRTFLVDTCTLNRSGMEARPDYSGSLRELLNILG